MIKFKAKLTENEMKFMEVWTDVLRRTYSIPSNRLDEAASYIGFRRSGGCSTCLRNDAAELNNIYRRLLEKYNLQLELDKSLELLELIEAEDKINLENDLKLKYDYEEYVDIDTGEVISIPTKKKNKK